MDKEYLISLYCEGKKTLREIGRLLGTNHNLIRRRLVSWGIEIRRYNPGRKRIEVKCGYCQKPIYRYPSTFSSKRGNFCSYNCIHSWQREGDNMRGKNCPNWRGGIAPFSSDILKTKDFLDLKQEVLKEFPICAMCGDDSFRHIHHIKTRREHPELTFDKHNLITLCRSCHATIKGKEKVWEAYFTRIICKGGELLETPEKDNQQPSRSNVISMVGRKVHRLTGEDSQTDKPDTSAAPERDDIVGACR